MTRDNSAEARAPIHDDTLCQAIKVTEYKYFGDYKMDVVQRGAVDALVEFARHHLTFSAEQNTGGMPGRDRKAIADIINPNAFRLWQSMYDYCIRQGDDEATARRYADETHKLDCDAAFAKADAILSLAATGGTGAEAMREAAAKIAENIAPHFRNPMGDSIAAAIRVLPVTASQGAQS